MDQGRKIPPSRGITFENAADMVRLLTPARLSLFEAVKNRTLSIKGLAEQLGRDISAVRRDVDALEQYGLLFSEQVANPGHGRVRMVTAPARVSIAAEL
jgi:predicted transcriptional regulator